jgi:hypothetical protein
VPVVAVFKKRLSRSVSIFSSWSIRSFQLIFTTSERQGEAKVCLRRDTVALFRGNYTF